jgi:hypothetical protein
MEGIGCRRAGVAAIAGNHFHVSFCVTRAPKRIRHGRVTAAFGRGTRFQLMRFLFGNKSNVIFEYCCNRLGYAQRVDFYRSAASPSASRASSTSPQMGRSRRSAAAEKIPSAFAAFARVGDPPADSRRMHAA